MITAHGSVEAAISALKAGAFDFISKPIELENLRRIVSNALQLEGDPSHTQDAVDGELTGSSTGIRVLRQQISKLARSQAPVHIHGESGSGKEVVARLIHNNGPRAAGAFVAVNCGAIPPELMESELFGHLKGSFTGASQDKIGLFQAASGGTLFLDEVADLPLAMQVKLLRAIQEKTVRPVGASEEQGTDIRLLSATHKDLDQEVEDGRFRQDLYYRINVIDVMVPSLRERLEDLPALTEAILKRITSGEDKAEPCLEKSALEAMRDYNFPGNVRELENMLERALALSDGENISADDLQFSRSGQEPSGKSAETSRRRDDTGHSVREAYGDMEGYLEDIEVEKIGDFEDVPLEQNRNRKTFGHQLP